MAGQKWITSKRFSGVRWYTHPERKHGIKPDMYFSIRFRVNGRRIEEAMGWSSEGWSESRAAAELAKLKDAGRTGEGARTLQEKRQKAEEARQAEEARRKAQEAALKQERLDNVTFEEFFRNEYFPSAMHQKKKTSYIKEDQHVRRWIAPVIGRLPLKAVGPLHLERIKKNMTTAGMSPRSIEYVLATIRQVYRYARRIDRFQGDPPTTKIKKPRFDNIRRRFLTREEANRLLKALAERSQDLADMALLSLNCGLRFGEVAALAWSDVDDQQRILTLRDTKSRRTRVAFMTETVREMLARRGRGAPTDLVFPARGGIRRDRISKVFADVVETLGLNEGIEDPRQKVVFHTCRHSYASWLVEQGTDLYTVKELMGHRTLSQTERYSHLNPGKLRDAVKDLEQSMRPAPTAEVIELKR